MSLPFFHPQGTAGNSEVGGGSNRMEEGAAMDRLELIFKKGRGADYKVLGTLPALRSTHVFLLTLIPAPPPARGCGLQAQPQSGCGGNSTSVPQQRLDSSEACFIRPSVPPPPLTVFTLAELPSHP